MLTKNEEGNYVWKTLERVINTSQIFHICEWQHPTNLLLNTKITMIGDNIEFNAVETFEEITSKLL